MLCRGYDDSMLWEGTRTAAEICPIHGKTAREKNIATRQISAALLKGGLLWVVFKSGDYISRVAKSRALLEGSIE